MKIGRYEFRLEPPLSPLEIAAAIVAAVPAFIAGYLYVHTLLEQVSL